MNKTVISLLEKQMGLRQDGRRRRPYGLDHLYGAWITKRAGEFDRARVEERVIDPELWLLTSDAYPIVLGTAGRADCSGLPERRMARASG